MRTTLTLDDDVADKLKHHARRSGKSFKQVVNEMLRRGLNAPREMRPKKRFTVRARALGLRPGVSLDNIGDLLEQLDGPENR